MSDSNPEASPNKDIPQPYTNANIFSPEVGGMERNTYYNQRKPMWFNPKPKTTLEGTPLDPKLNPHLDSIEETPSHGETKDSTNDIEESSVSLLGVRSWINKKRLDRVETQLEKTKRRSEVVRFVGEQVLLRGQYRDFQESDPEEQAKYNALSPNGDFRNRRAAKKIEKYNRKRLNTDATRHNIALTYGKDIQSANKKKTGKILPDSTETTRPLADKYNVGVNIRHHNWLQKQSDKYDKKIAKVVATPFKKAKKLQSKREKLVKNSVRLENAKKSE